MQETIFRAALFDLDGVVFDTEPQYSVFWGSQCRLYHPEHPGLEHEIKGQTLTQIYDQWFSGALTPEQEIITKRLNAFEQQMHYEYINGFETFMGNLRAHGIKTALVTSSNRIKMRVIYQRHQEFTHLFDTILTAEDFERSKPDPDCYLKAAQRLHTEVDHCVVFEDSINGLRSGRAAGMKVVGLTTTNPVDRVAELSDMQLSNYLGIDYESILDQMS